MLLKFHTTHVYIKAPSFPYGKGIQFSPKAFLTDSPVFIILVMGLILKSYHTQNLTSKYNIGSAVVTKFGTWGKTHSSSLP